jgi:hypothetical protein
MGARALQTLLDELGSTPANPAIVVFDLDSTLFSTAARNLRILHEFSAAHGGEHPGLAEAASRVSLADMGWNVTEPLRRAGFEPDPSLIRFWKERFFTDAYCALDEPAPGAVAFVNAVFEAGALVYYLTGRHQHGMGIGTLTSLMQHGFPTLSGRAVLHLKPDFETADKAFKDEAITRIRELGGRVFATFENEPGNANLFARTFPGAMHFWIQTIHSPDAENPRDDLIRFNDFSFR